MHLYRIRGEKNFSNSFPQKFALGNGKYENLINLMAFQRIFRNYKVEQAPPLFYTVVV